MLRETLSFTNKGADWLRHDMMFYDAKLRSLSRGEKGKSFWRFLVRMEIESFPSDGDPEKNVLKNGAHGRETSESKSHATRGKLISMAEFSHPSDTGARDEVN